MNKVPIWFDRKFQFTLPADQLPYICVRLRGAPARLEEMSRAAPRDALLRKPEGKWSAQEHAGHLLDLEPLWMTRIDDLQAGGEVLAIADLTNRKTDDANHNSRALAEILAGFRTARLRLLDRVGNFDPALYTRSMLHPRLRQPMRLVDHLYFVAEHDDHHLAKIWELIKA